MRDSISLSQAWVNHLEGRITILMRSSIRRQGQRINPRLLLEMIRVIHTNSTKLDRLPRTPRPLSRKIRVIQKEKPISEVIIKIINGMSLHKVSKNQQLSPQQAYEIGTSKRRLSKSSQTKVSVSKATTLTKQLTLHRVTVGRASGTVPNPTSIWTRSSSTSPRSKLKLNNSNNKWMTTRGKSQRSRKSSNLRTTNLLLNSRHLDLTRIKMEVKSSGMVGILTLTRERVVMKPNTHNNIWTVNRTEITDLPPVLELSPQSSTPATLPAENHQSLSDTFRWYR